MQRKLSSSMPKKIPEDWKELREKFKHCLASPDLLDIPI
jgi:hypothetical protein